ncbi:MAG: threonine--tRNA ligase [Armatimonadota bacterium]|jgi:threonyl-tRNA synthetase
MPNITLTYPDGSAKEYEVGVTAAQVAADIGPRLAKAAVAARLDGELVDLTHPIDADAAIEIVTFDSDEGKEVHRHSASHVMAQAVTELFPDTRLAIGPATQDGFYYDLDSPTTFTEEDLPKIEARMQEIVERDLPIERQEMPLQEARRLYEEQGNEYKVELLDEVEDERVTLYRQGDFVDLCRGPHLPSTAGLGAFKLLSLAGAYWRGDERRPMLQRIYGTAHPRHKDLDEHLHRLEEARRRDHRRLGRDLDLFSIQDDVGPGLVLWHPKGSVVREVIEDFWRHVHRERGYDLVYTPHIGRFSLWETSGHVEWFMEDMYSPMEVEGQQYMVKPMNCPFHILIFKSQTRSYRDLPLRMGELGTVYRYERSGVLRGMLRVRGFTQDDAHIFCRPDQLEEELIEVIDLAQYMMGAFGYEEYEVELSARDPEHTEEYIGDDATWERAEAALVAALAHKEVSYHRAEGEAKFYGPSIDISLKDALGRLWQGPTIQCDFNEPERFDVTYAAADGSRERVVMVHRTVLGTMERFIAGLVEHVAGAFPVWLAPVQATVLPIADRHAEYAAQVAEQLQSAGVRAEMDSRSETLGHRIRDAELQKVPYLLVAGDREVEAGTVSVRARGEGDRGPAAVEEFLEALQPELKPPV